MRISKPAAAAILAALIAVPVSAQGEGPLKVGIAVRDVTPDGPVWLNGYAARKRPSERVDTPLLVQAVAFQDAGGEKLVLVAVDNCEANREFVEPVLAKIKDRHAIPAEAVIIVWSHTHSAPCLPGVLDAMFNLDAAEREKIAAYGEKLSAAMVGVVGDALADLRPASLKWGKSRAGFGMNRRIFVDDRVNFGENPEGPADHEVPVLSVRGEKGELRAVLFGYACHATSLHGEDFYLVSGDYIAYARQALESVFSGARAVFLTGCGADINPASRGRLMVARQHGLELAGSVAGVLGRPMRPVAGPIRRSYARLALPLAPPPSREKLLEDSKAKDPHIRNRAQKWLGMLDEGRPMPNSVDCPVAVVRFGGDLTLIFIAGEVVVDYSLRLKRELAWENPWPVGYAFEIPCYIPSARILKEGGYEADSSLIYYGIYGPILGRCEKMIVDKLREMVKALKK